MLKVFSSWQQSPQNQWRPIHSFFRRGSSGSPYGAFTIGLIVMCLLVSILAWSDPAMYIFGMSRDYLAAHDYLVFVGQLILFQFIHAGLFHWISNSLFLYLFGRDAEESMGLRRYVSFFIFGACFVAGALLIFSPDNTIGISGFTMAILAYITTDMYYRHDPQYRGGLVFIAINVLVGIGTNISLVAHLSGAIWGGLTYLILKRWKL